MATNERLEASKLRDNTSASVGHSLLAGTWDRPLTRVAAGDASGVSPDDFKNLSPKDLEDKVHGMTDEQLKKAQAVVEPDQKNHPEDHFLHELAVTIRQEQMERLIKSF